MSLGDESAPHVHVVLVVNASCHVPTLDTHDRLRLECVNFLKGLLDVISLDARCGRHSELVLIIGSASLDSERATVLCLGKDYGVRLPAGNSLYHVPRQSLQAEDLFALSNT